MGATLPAIIEKEIRRARIRVALKTSQLLVIGVEPATRGKRIQEVLQAQSYQVSVIKSSKRKVLTYAKQLRGRYVTLVLLALIQPLLL